MPILSPTSRNHSLWRYHGHCTTYIMSHVSSQLSVAVSSMFDCLKKTPWTTATSGVVERSGMSTTSWRMLAASSRLVLQQQGMLSHPVWFIEITGPLASRWTQTAGDDVIRHQTSDAVSRWGRIVHCREGSGYVRTHRRNWIRSGTLNQWSSRAVALCALISWLSTLVVRLNWLLTAVVASMNLVDQLARLLQ